MCITKNLHNDSESKLKIQEVKGKFTEIQNIIKGEMKSNLDKIKMLVFDEADEILSYGFKDTIYNIVQTIPRDTQICLFSATLPKDVLELTEKFMNEPEKILVKKEQLTLEGIKQF